jgi:Flp pilus assembly protein TadB
VVPLTRSELRSVLLVAIVVGIATAEPLWMAPIIVGVAVLLVVYLPTFRSSRDAERPRRRPR